MLFRSTVRTREDIFVMARTKPGDGRKQRALFTKRLAVAGSHHFEPKSATLDDLVFLPANLSRLVIDPYRDACTVETVLGGGALELDAPFLVTGFDDAPDEVRAAVAHGVRSRRLAYVGRRPLADDVPWLQLVGAGDSVDARAEAVIAVGGDLPWAPEPAREGQPVGVATSSAGVAAAVPFALDRGLEFLLLDGTGGAGAGTAWPELAGAPDLTAIRDTIRVMRALNREEDLEILWFGGVRSGTDVVKLLGLGADAAAVGVGLALAVGGRIEDGSVAWYGDVTLEERSEQAELYLQALRAEASIMPRCTGKTNIHTRSTKCQ